MKNLMKLIVLAALTALLICAVTCASADEKIYTSPVFKLPADRVTEWAEGLPDEEPPVEPQPEETTEPGTGEEGQPEETTESEKAKERRVRIFSSQGKTVREGEQIFLTSELEGFDGLDVTYQWQVDRGDGAGWTNVEGATRPNHVFVASRETIRYTWRLIVNVDE